MKSIIKEGALLLAIGMLAACSSSEEGNSNEGTNSDAILDLTVPAQTIQLTTEQRAFVNTNNDFSFNLFRALTDMELVQTGGRFFC